jgi:hypothetical protein
MVDQKHNRRNRRRQFNKKRNPEKVLMDRFTSPQVFRSRKIALQEREVERDLNNFLIEEGQDDERT